MKNYRMLMPFIIAITVVYFLTISVNYENLCRVVDFKINLTNIFSHPFIAILIVPFIICFIYSNKISNKINTNEAFEVIIADSKQQNMKRVDLGDFFKFIEYFMVTDMDARDKPLHPLCYTEGESIRISNNIRNLLQMLHFIVYSNDKDNFYHRFLVTKVGPNLQKYMKIPIRRLNYDEMVKNKIGKKFSFLKKTEIDKYWPRANLDSYHQNPQYMMNGVPFTINVHNYYSYDNTEINLLALQILMELVQKGDRSLFGQNIRPTEHISFENEFLIPMRSIINSMLAIINTDVYRDYVHKQRFSLKYRGLVFNPHMVEI